MSPITFPIYRVFFERISNMTENTIKKTKYFIHKIYFLWFFLCNLLSIFSANANEYETISIQEKINAIAPTDRQKLEDFFHSLFLHGDFAFTLFGNKPLGSIDLLIGEKMLNIETTIDFVGWEVWKKYQHLFLSSNYLFSYYDKIAENSFFGFLIINKKRCREIINQNLPLFKSCFSFQSTDDLIDRLCSTNFFSYKLEDRPNNFYLCLGLLFGYGEKSALFFERRMQLFREAAQYPYDLTELNEDDRQIIYYLDKTRLEKQVHHRPVNDVIEELNDLNRRKTFTRLTKTNNPLYLIEINGFVTFAEDPETEILQAENDALGKKLMEINYSDNFLEIILNRLLE